MSPTSSLLVECDHRDGPWPKLRVLVAGLGVAGLAMARGLADLGAMVVAIDERPSADALAELAAKGIEVRSDAIRLDVAGLPADVVVTSPGWRPDAPLLVAAQRAGIALWSDLELAWRLRPRQGGAPWLVITGTNGKTTAVQMLTAMLRADGLRAVAAGNVGLPVIEAVLSDLDYEVIAVEASSFQLHRTESMSPVAAVCLNLADDHLDWHGSAAAYAHDKSKVYRGATIAAVYNVADPATEKMVRDADVVAGCRAVGFTLGIPTVGQLGIVEGTLLDRAFLDERRSVALVLADFADFHPSLLRDGIPPKHIVEDALAAAALARAQGVSVAAVREGLRDFIPDAHRSARVAEVEGIRFIDDSKATNTHAALAALSGFAGAEVVWIAGGLTKGADLNPLVAAVGSKLRAVVLIGEDRGPFLDALARHAPAIPVIEINPIDTEEKSKVSTGELIMKRAVLAAIEVAGSGDTVLLAPAAASMDQFASYAQRGEAFSRAVWQSAGR